MSWNVFSFTGNNKTRYCDIPKAHAPHTLNTYRGGQGRKYESFCLGLKVEMSSPMPQPGDYIVDGGFEYHISGIGFGNAAHPDGASGEWRIFKDGSETDTD